jgi:hypothetical protein
MARNEDSRMEKRFDNMRQAHEDMMEKARWY